MKPVVSIIMGSTSDLPVMEKAAKFFDEMQVPFEMITFTPRAAAPLAKASTSSGVR